MAKKVKCHCGCGSQVSLSTERRHRIGKATPRVKASHAARQTIYAPEQHLHQTSKGMGLLTGHSLAPEIPYQPGPPGNAQMHPQDGNPNMDVDGGGYLNVEIEPTCTSDRTWGISGVNTDDSRVSEVIANIREEAQCPRYPVTIEDYVSDEEDDQDPSDDDGFDWHAEDDEMYTDGGLGVDDIINEDFERELAGFGINETLITSNSQLIVSPQLRKSPRRKLPSFATSHSRLRAT